MTARLISTSAAVWLPASPVLGMAISVQYALASGVKLVVTEVLCQRTDEVTGKMLGVALCGLQLQAVLADELPRREAIEMLFRRALAGGLD